MANESRVSELILRLRDEVSANTSKAQSSLISLQNAAKSFIGALGVGISAGGLVQFGRQLLDLGDRLSDLSDQTGISIGTLAALRPIADQTGTSLEGLAKGVNKMMISIVEAQDGTGQQAEALRKLGFSSQEALGFMSDPQGFLEILAKKLANVTTHAERLALAKSLVGKAGAELVPMLLKIAEEGLPRVSTETERAYKRLGELKDKAVGATAALTDFFATAAGKAVGGGPTDLEVRIAQIRKMLESIEQRKGGLETGAISERERALVVDLNKLLAERNNLEEKRPGIVSLEGDQTDPKVVARKLAQTEEEMAQRTKAISERVKKAVGDSLAHLEEMDKEFGATLQKNTAEFLSSGGSAGEKIRKMAESLGANLNEALKRSVGPSGIVDAFQIESAEQALKELSDQAVQTWGMDVPGAIEQAFTRVGQTIEHLKSKIPAALPGTSGPTVVGGGRASEFGTRNPMATWSKQMIDQVNQAAQGIQPIDIRINAVASPARPFSEFFQREAPKMIADLADKAASTPLNFNTDFSQAIFSTLDSIANAKTFLTQQGGSRSGLHPSFGAGTQTRLLESQNILDFLMILAGRSSGSGVAEPSRQEIVINGPLIDMRDSVITSDAVEKANRQLLPALESALRMASGKNLSIRTLS